MGFRRWRFMLPLRLRSLFHQRAVERDLDDELAFHLEMAEREGVARGLNAAEARRAALARFGGIEARKDECRDTRGLAWLDGIRQDVRHAWRGLRRTPGY